MIKLEAFGISDTKIVLTPKEIARVLEVTPETVRNWIRRKCLPGRKIGGRYLISRISFEKFLKENRFIERRQAW